MLQRIKKTLSETYPCRIELHAHTSPASPCADVTPEETVRQYLDAGFDGLVITNHFSPAAYPHTSREDIVNAHLSDYARACKAAEGTKLKVYLCAEIRFEENPNDYLLFGVDPGILERVYDYFPKGLAAFREEVPLPGSVLVQAHPFRNGCIPVDGHLLDGVEVFNMHPNHNSRCALASLFSKENGFTLTTAGSDFHHLQPGHIATTALRCRELPEDSFALAKLLRSGDFIFEIGEQFVL